MATEGEWYYLESDVGTVLDVRGGVRATQAEVWMYNKNGSDAQKWRLLPDGHIQNALGYYLDVRGANPNPEAQVWMYDRNDTKAQKWIYSSERFLVAKDLNINLVLDVRGASPEKGTPVWMYPKNGTIAQKWRFTPVNP